MSHDFQKDISGCGLAGIINKDGKRVSGSFMIKCMCLMNDRGNGLGAGFAAYGIYPEYKELYAFHVMYDELGAQRDAEEYIKKNYHIEKKGADTHSACSRDYNITYTVALFCEAPV